MIGEIRQNFTEASASVGLILATALSSNKNTMKAIGLHVDWQKNFAQAFCFFVYFFAIIVVQHCHYETA